MAGDTKTYGFKDTSAERLWNASIQAVSALGYSVLHSDQASKVLTFNTGRSMSSWAGQDLSVTLTPSGQNCNMTLGGSLGKGGNPMGGGSQVFAWGEKGRLIQTFAAKVNALLPSVSEPTNPTTAPAATPPTGDLVEQIERLAALHASGALTDAEFQNAKSRLLSQ